MKKEIAKFLSGVCAWESIVHASLWLSNAEPTVFGITLSTTLNIVQTFVPGIISLLLGYYAWSGKNVKNV